MQIHKISPTTKIKKQRRVGRGGKRGTTSGRGTKGQKARAGAKFRPAEREFLKKIPKLRGYKFKSFRPKPAVVNLSALNKRLREGDIVSPQTLVAAGLVRAVKGRIPKIKILGDGELKKKLIFKDVKFSRSAARKLTPDTLTRQYLTKP